METRRAGADERMRSAGRPWMLVACMVLVIGVLLSALAGALWHATALHEQRQSFASTADDVTATLGTLIRRDTDLVGTLRAVMTTDPQLTATGFDNWYATLEGSERQAGSIGTAVVASVPASQLSAFERHRNADRTFRSRLGKLLTPIARGHQSHYCVLLSGGEVVPLNSLTASLAQQDWCQTSSETGFLEGGLLHTAADTGQFVTLPLAIPGLHSTFIEAAYYRRGAPIATVAQRRAALQGWIVSSFDMPTVIRQAIGANANLSVALYHSNPGLSSVSVASSGAATDGSLEQHKSLSIEGWMLSVRGRPRAARFSPAQQGLLVAAAGSLMSLMLFLLLFLLARSRERALGMVAEKTGELRHQALHDPLTGLPNRTLAIDRAEQMLVRGRRAQVPLAALYLDVEGFKQINDTFGHRAGDEFLRIVAQRIESVIRDEDTAARLAGDEFLVLLDVSTLDAGPQLVAERLLEVLREPCDVGESVGRPLSLTTSIGIAYGLGDSAEQLLADADVALYVAKASGKDSYVVFESGMQTAAQDRLRLEMDLGDAVHRDQLFLLYQPTFDLNSETVIGAEALLRWRHPERGVIPPDTFIPIAEACGMIIPIGRWVLLQACSQAAQWHRRGHSLGISVNVSARQLDVDDLIDHVRVALVESGLDPGALTLEITETTLMRDPQATAERLWRLKELGVRIAIDDFGTGYSSLAYLREFPVDALKIDRSFISGIAASTQSAALIHTLVRLGKTLKLETLAEGIEDYAQLRALQRQHCDQGQGFLFARPLDPAALEEFLDAPGKRDVHALTS